MFSIGLSEKLGHAGAPLVRHSIVWLGFDAAETSQGLFASHPLCQIIARLVASFGFCGTWLTFHNVRQIRSFETKARLLQFNRNGWTVDPEQTSRIRGHRWTTRQHPWAFDRDPVLPKPLAEMLICGAKGTYALVSNEPEDQDSLRVILPASEAFIRPSVVDQFLRRGCCFVHLGRTHTDNSPGIHIIAMEGAVNPEALVEAQLILSVHRGVDAGLAWSYPRQATLLE